jgi:hypothetical protein
MKSALVQAIACGGVVVLVSGVAAPFFLSDTRGAGGAETRSGSSVAAKAVKFGVSGPSAGKKAGSSLDATARRAKPGAAPLATGEHARVGHAPARELEIGNAASHARSDEAKGMKSARGSTGPHALTAEERAELASNLAKINWQKSIADLVAALKSARANGPGAGGDTSVEAAQINLALAQAAEELGLPGPAAALGDPTVRSVVVPAWLQGLGVDLDDSQAAAISSLCLASQPANASGQGTFLEQRQAAIQSRINLEQSFSQVLTPDQVQIYTANVANDPLMRPSAQRLNLSAADPTSLAGIVASYWSYQFQLGPSSQAAAQQVASQYVAATLAVPPAAPNLDAEAARIAGLDRANTFVGIQQQAEQSLASSPALSAAEQQRAGQGSKACLQLTISH